MTPHQSFEQFASAILPDGVPDESRSRFQACARFAKAKACDAPFPTIEQDQVVFVANGSTKLVAHASQGREQVLAFHFAGDLAYIHARAAHAYTLCALENCELVTFPAADFMMAAQGEALVVNEVLLRALLSLDRCREKSIALGRKTAQERLAGFLIAMAERIGSRQDDGCVLDLPMSRRDIGDSLGLTIETVSRQMSDLRNLGLLETTGRSLIRIRDLPSLTARAGHLSQAA